MKRTFILIAPLLGLLVSGCSGDSKKSRSDEVVSQRFIHKYGYDVSSQEWQASNYPGQVITTMRNGVTITSTYADGVLNGPTTYTYPHSQTLESLNIFENGELKRKVMYDVKGLPDSEQHFYKPGHVKVTAWYKTGTPRSIEEYADDLLIEGEYFTVQNETEARVERGFGHRMSRNREGFLLSKEKIDEGQVSLRETFHANGTPHIITPYAGGAINGEKRVFAATGEPVSIEYFIEGRLNGIATYFQNGCKYLEVGFKQGLRNGLERYFIDGVKLVEENEWNEGKRHGLSIVYLDGMSKKEWFYNDERVTKHKFDDLCERERTIAIMNERAYSKYDQQ